MHSRFLFDSPKWIFMGLWLAGNAALFGYTFWKYYVWDDYHYLRVITGVSTSTPTRLSTLLGISIQLTTTETTLWKFLIVNRNVLIDKFHRNPLWPPPPTCQILVLFLVFLIFISFVKFKSSKCLKTLLLRVLPHKSDVVIFKKKYRER